MRRTFAGAGLAVAVLCVCAAAGSAQENQWWAWTEKGDHHKAVCQVQQGSYMGAGGLIWKSEDGKLGIVATVGHNVESGGAAIVRFPAWGEAHTTLGPVLIRDMRQDSALVFCDPPDDCPVIPLLKTGEMPPPGTLLEATGWGGPTNRLRHWHAKVAASNATNATLQTSVLSGDSGGPLVHDGKLVGVIWGGHNRGQAVPTQDGEQWHLVFPAECTSAPHLHNLWKQVEGKNFQNPIPLRAAGSGSASPSVVSTAPGGIAYQQPSAGRIIYQQPTASGWYHQPQGGAYYCPPGRY